MAQPRTVIDLLSEQSEETLIGMQDSLRAELARISVEAKQVEEALVKKTRRSRSNAGGGRLTRQQVFEVVENSDEPLSATEAAILLELKGTTTTSNAVRNHLVRLEEEGRLVRDGNQFGLPPRTNPFVPAAAKDDDIPF